jgi:hypothetical protein
MTNAERLSANLFLRVAPSDLRRLEDLVAALPLATRHGLARFALRLGLESIEADPTRLVLQSAEVEGGA